MAAAAKAWKLLVILGVLFNNRMKCSSVSLHVKNVNENNTQNTSNNETERLPFNPCAGRYGPFCLDCKILLTCAEDMINMQTCASMDSSKPYCKGSGCTAQPVANCNVNSMRCTSVGQFPHPTDCNAYYFCSDLSSQGAIKFKCPVGYVYDSPTGWCKQQKVASDCETINCIGKSNTYQILSHDKSILAYCADTPEYKETLMFRCPDFTNMEYDPDTLMCNFVCEKDGRYPDKFDCTRYYECYRNRNISDYTHLQCPPGFIFNAAKGMCVIGQC